VLTAHAGKARDGGTRGSSALEDWPDTVLRISADDDGQRTVSAIGRDVELAPHELRYEPLTRALTLGEPASAASDRRAATNLIGVAVDVVEQWPGRSGNDLLRWLVDEGRGPQRAAFLAALKQATAQGLIRVEIGGHGRPSLHYPAGR
jgi:hypothetical protein